MFEEVSMDRKGGGDSQVYGGWDHKLRVADVALSFWDPYYMKKAL